MNDLLVNIAPTLIGELQVQTRSKGLVLLLDGSAGGREQGRHRYVAGLLQRRQFATLLLEPGREPAAVGEAAEAAAIHRLSHSLWQAMSWTRNDPRLRALALGIYGSGPGAAAAMVCAAERSDPIAAIVAAAPPFDLVSELSAEMARIRTPMLVVVGQLDDELLSQARQAYLRLGAADKRLEVIPRATRLFEEAGALERVAIAAADWFERFLVQPSLR